MSRIRAGASLSTFGSGAVTDPISSSIPTNAASPTPQGCPLHREPADSQGCSVLPAEVVVDRLAAEPTVAPVILGYAHGLLSATLCELAEERFLRDTISSRWATHLGVTGTLATDASACLAALADAVGRLVGVAEAMEHYLGASWVIDPDRIALGYMPDSAPVAAVHFLPGEVRLVRRQAATSPADNAGAQRWSALAPLVRAWCRDGDLQFDATRRTLWPPTTVGR